MIRYWYNIVPKYWIIYVEKIINKTRSQEMISKDIRCDFCGWTRKSYVKMTYVFSKWNIKILKDIENWNS